MANKKDFSWVPFYSELADKLIPYQSNRKALIAKIEGIFISANINQPTLEEGGKLIDIDPFTIFGLFNKGISLSNRISLLKEFKTSFGVSAELPTGFDGVPTLQNLNSTFYWFIHQRGKSDIDDLWSLFINAMKVANGLPGSSKVELEKYFDICVGQKGNGTGKITMGLYWIASDYFLSLSNRDEWYIYDSKQLPNSVVSALPAIGNSRKITYKEYSNLMGVIKPYLSSPNSALKSLNEISYEAWRYSEQVNKQIKADKKAQEEKAKQEEIAKEQQNEPTAQAEIQKYDKDDFLSEVYLSDHDYETIRSLLLSKKNLILTGAPGVGKTFAAKRLAYSMLGSKDDSHISFVQFHQNYGYEDFVMGYRPNENGGFQIEVGAFTKFVEKARKDPSGNYFFIIDEINRGNMSKIFGELLMLIESDKRKEEYALDLPYHSKDVSEPFFVPGNLYIIGMMNTADRSLAMIDYALRRRFAFFRMEPGFDSDGFRKYMDEQNSPKLKKVVAAIKTINDYIRSNDSLGDGFEIGHSYLCCDEGKHISDEEIDNAVLYEICPLIDEYLFDDKEEADKWKSELKAALS